MIPLYRCWRQWTKRQRLWVLPAATLGDAIATVLLTGATAAILGPTHAHPLNMIGGSLFSAADLRRVLRSKRPLDGLKETMHTLRMAGHDVGLAPVLQMAILPVLAVGFTA